MRFVNELIKLWYCLTIGNNFFFFWFGFTFSIPKGGDLYFHSLVNQRETKRKRKWKRNGNDTLRKERKRTHLTNTLSRMMRRRRRQRRRRRSADILGAWLTYHLGWFSMVSWLNAKRNGGKQNETERNEIETIGGTGDSETEIETKKKLKINFAHRSSSVFLGILSSWSWHRRSSLFFFHFFFWWGLQIRIEIIATTQETR